MKPNTMSNENMLMETCKNSVNYRVYGANMSGNMIFYPVNFAKKWYHSC